MGQNTLHAAIEERFPNSFLPDTFSSANQYFEGLFNDPPNRVPRPPGMASILFRLDHRRKLVCLDNPSHQTVDKRTIDTIVLSHESYNNIQGPPMTYQQTPQLLKLWASDLGLRRVSARICKKCPNSNDLSADTTLPRARPRLLEQSRLGTAKTPPHLHIHLELGYYLGQNDAEAFKMMRECDLPYELILNDHTYHMRARGFWAGSHYWCKVVRTVGGVTGVWLHNDLHNAGLATLVTTDLASIGGQSPSTSWAMYSRAPNETEAVIIKQSLAKIQKSVGTKVAADQPFSQIEEDSNEWEDWEGEGYNEELISAHDGSFDGQQTDDSDGPFGSDCLNHDSPPEDFASKKEDPFESDQNHQDLSELFHSDDKPTTKIELF